MAVGSDYFFPAGRFHRSVAAEGAITLLTRGPIVSVNAQVIRPIGVATVCPFSKPKPAAECWALIADMVAP
jgi:hypothetical protein